MLLLCIYGETRRNESFFLLREILNFHYEKENPRLPSQALTGQNYVPRKEKTEAVKDPLSIVEGQCVIKKKAKVLENQMYLDHMLAYGLSAQ